MSDKYRINGFGDLEQYGINCLTGEACAYSMRLLCDYNLDGALLLSDFLGIRVSANDGNNWNSQVNGMEALGSIMLTPDALWRLAEFAMLQYGYDRVVAHTPEHHGVYGFDMTDSYAEKYMENNRDQRIIHNPHSGNRNTHQMTGRTV